MKVDSFISLDKENGSDKRQKYLDMMGVWKLERESRRAKRETMRE